MTRRSRPAAALSLLLALAPAPRAQVLDEAALSTAGGAQPDAPLARPAVRAPSKLPDWVEEAQEAPVPEEVEGLADRVAASPRDRAARARHAYALSRAGWWAKLRDGCLDWQRFDPANPSVYELLGEAFAGLGDAAKARRARWSIAEVAPGDAGLIDRAGFLALKGGDPEGAAELFQVAIDRRPDRANSYRGLALARWSAGDHAGAVKALDTALSQGYDGRYGDVARVLREEREAVLAAWQSVGGDPPGAGALRPLDALRVTLHWDTDASDVDLHVVDPRGAECFYSQKQVPSKLELYQDLTQGLGPEVTVVPPGALLPGTYHVGVKYFAAGPMGVSRGVVVVARPAVAGKPVLKILPFTLLPPAEGEPAQDMRWLMAVPGLGDQVLPASDASRDR